MNLQSKINNFVSKQREGVVYLAVNENGKSCGHWGHTPKKIAEQCAKRLNIDNPREKWVVMPKHEYKKKYGLGG